LGGGSSGGEVKANLGQDQVKGQDRSGRIKSSFVLHVSPYLKKKSYIKHFRDMDIYSYLDVSYYFLAL
jgi:hypothetical protein